MRLTAIILLAAVLQVSAKGYTQTVTLSVKNAPLEKVFAEIKKQTGYAFLYTDQMLAGTTKISINVKSATIEQVLEICFKNQPLSYTLVNKTVVLKPKDDKSPNGLGVIPGPDPESLSTIDITGKVTDVDGNPLSGASVKVKGTSNGTTTHSDGTFILRGVSNDAVLEISFVGYEVYTVPVNSKSTVTATLKLNIISNPEVIINKGYYTEKQKTSVSNVGKVTGDVIAKQPVNNVLLALQARVPGLFITQSSGISGSGLKVRIQGQNSIYNGSDPLYVVDGVPIDPQLPRTGIDWVLVGGYTFGGYFGNPLSYLNPMDIESVEVLKDADATAIYGSRAANGAILITTKKGKAGAMKFDLNMEAGWGKMTRRMDMMNTRQYLDMRYEAFANDGINWKDPSVSANDLKVWDTTRYTNWQDELLGGTAHYNNINASLSGGSPNVRYLFSGTYNKQTTVFPVPDFGDQKVAVHFNLNANNTNQKLKMQFSGNYMFDDNELPWENMTQNALLLEPDAPPLLNADGSINWAPDANGNTTFNHGNVMTLKYLKYVNKTRNLVSNLKLDYTIIPGLNIGSSFGYNYMRTNDFKPTPLIATAPELRATSQRSASFGDRNIESWIIEPQASYRLGIGKGTLDVLTGITFQRQNANAGYIYGNGQLSDELLDNINSAAFIGKAISSTSEYSYNAVFGRVNYNWIDRYILSLNVRRDGSTRFGSNNRFQNFGSVGAAWIFSSENLFKSNFHFISFGKLRASYGTTGSDQIGDYKFMSLYDLTTVSAPYQGVTGLLPAGLPNPNLQWEVTKKLQAGVDLAFVKDKIVINGTWVRNRSSNQLLPYNLPTPSGYSSYLTNFPATIQNMNWEFMVTGKIIQKKNFTYTSSFNLTIPHNTLIEFPGLANSTYSNSLVIGQPIDISSKLYQWVGVGSGTGDYLFTDKDGHATVAPNFLQDASVLISLFPKLYGGFDNTIVFKNLQLDFMFQFVRQTGYNDASIWNVTNYPGMFAAGFSNQPVTVLDRWQKPGDMNKSVARYSTHDVSYSYIVSSDHRYTDASYIRLKNVSLSWELPQKWSDKAHLRSLRVYVHGQNLMTLTNYTGLDPETQSFSSLPPLRVWTVGLQIEL